MNELSALHMLLLAQFAEVGDLTPEEAGVRLGVDADVAAQLCRDLEAAGLIERLPSL